jgi:hypothetical protein
VHTVSFTPPLNNRSLNPGSGASQQSTPEDIPLGGAVKSDFLPPKLGPKGSDILGF